jgi:hypothetical protein
LKQANDEMAKFLSNNNDSPMVPMMPTDNDNADDDNDDDDFPIPCAGI